MKSEKHKIEQFGDVDSSLIRSHEHSHGKRGSKQETIGGLTVQLKFGEKQLHKGLGLHFIIQLKNLTNQDIRLCNPLDSLRILVNDEKGWPMKLPPGRPPRALVNSPNDKQVPRSFEVLSITSTNGDQSLLELADDEFFTVQRGTSYEFEIQVSKIQNVDKKDQKAFSHHHKVLPAGKYKLQVLMPLIIEGGNAEYRMCESGQVEIELADAPTT
jgi:hypothetical protein